MVSRRKEVQEKECPWTRAMLPTRFELQRKVYRFHCWRSAEAWCQEALNLFKSMCTSFPHLLHFHLLLQMLFLLPPHSLFDGDVVNVLFSEVSNLDLLDILPKKGKRHRSNGCNTWFSLSKDTWRNVRIREKRSDTTQNLRVDSRNLGPFCGNLWQKCASTTLFLQEL